MARATTPRTTTRKKKTVRIVRRGVNRFALAPVDDFFKTKHFVHYEIESKEWGTRVKEYIKKNYDKKIVSLINRLPDWKVSSASHWATTAFLLETKPDMVPEVYRSGIDKWINLLATEGATIVEEKKSDDVVKKVVYVPSIQDRINDQSKDACEAIEEWLEEYIVDPVTFNTKGFDFPGHFAKMKISQAHARKIKKYYESWAEEANIVVNMLTPAQIEKIKDEKEKDEAQQVREGYSNVSKANAKKWAEALENLLGACNVVIESSNATRKPRAKKAPSKDKLVAKLKYKDQDNKYQIVSVNPLELLGATEVWVFNVKTRKLGKYVAAEDCRTMTVKGTTLIGFDESKSVQKTLRKPEEVIKEFKKSGKVKLRTFMTEINSVEIKLNGRLNEDTVILKIDN
jgi:hypothetical protein